MITGRGLLSMLVWGFLALGASGAALAITLPDSSTCNTTGGTSCFKITNNSTFPLAITGAIGTANGVAVTGDAGSSSGRGVVGYTLSGIGVEGNAQTGMGIHAASNYGVALRAEVVSGNDAIQGFTDADCCSGGYFANTGHGNGIYVTGINGGIAVHGVNVGGWAGYFEGDVFATGSYQSSDVRLKTNIKDGRYGLGEVLKLKSVTFAWKNDKTAKTQVGLIAQDVSKIMPELVTEDREGMLAVNYVGLMPVMVKAVQEQQKLIQKLEARVATLERDRAPASRAAMFGSGSGALVLAMAPIGLLVAIRRRKK